MHDEGKAGLEHISDTDSASAKVGSSPDTEIPLSHNDVQEKHENIVCFDGDNDPTNPLNWQQKQKWGIVVLLSTMTAVVQLATVICAPVAPQILEEFHSNSGSYLTLLVSIWELGEIVGPLLVAPISELYGRLPVYHVGNILFVACSIGAALSTNISMLIAFRFLGGMSVVSLTLNPGVVGDLFAVEHRGGAMAIMGLTPILGAMSGPIVGSYLGQAGWRWTFWLPAILAGVLEVLFAAVYRETYPVRILAQKAERLRRETGNPEKRSQYDKGESATALFQKALLRPIKTLISSPTALILSLYVSVVYGYSYLILTTITEVFEGVYGFPERSVGLVFLGLCIGMTSGAILCRLTLDRFVQRQSAVSGHATPEQRLPPVVLGGLVLPAGLFVYGWTARSSIHWIVPILATGVLGFGLMLTTIPANSYLVDSFGIYAASAIAANLVLRNVFGAVFPLAGPPLYDNLGLGWGNSVLGFVALAFIPVPLLLMRYGERVRRWEGRADGLTRGE